MSYENDERWKEVSQRIQREKLELEREIDRQRLLDQLAASKTRNVELETALAKLARDQDRLVLAERERILKRAQAAQATALLVQEANWAKNRMETEMRLARERLHLFPDPIASPSPLPSKSDPPKQVRANTLFPTNPITQEAHTADPLPPFQMATLVSSRSSANGAGTPSDKQSVRSSVKGAPSQSAPAVIPEQPAETDLVSSVTDQVQSSVADAAAGVVDTTNKISDALSSSYSGMLSSFRAVVDAVPQIVSSEPEPTTPMPVPKITDNPVKSDSLAPPSVLPPPSPPLAVKPGVETKALLPPPKAGGPVVVGEFPGRPEMASEGQAKVIQQRTKGQWTDPTLHAQAAVVLDQLIVERDLTIQKNPLLMERLYGLPGSAGVGSSVSVSPVQPDWVAAADAWVEAVTGSSVKKAQKGKSKIDPAIASLTGVDPDLKEEGGSQTKAEDQPGDPPEQAAQPEDSQVDAKGKKKCVIM